MIEVMIVDDHPVVRDGMSAMLGSEKGFKIRASAESAEQAIAFCEKNGPPDVIVSDIRMDGMSGLEMLPRIKKSYPDAKILLLAGMPLKSEVEEARAAGASGYLPKSAKRGAIAAAIRRIVSEPGVFVEDEYTTPPSILSEREGEILRYMALGKTREEIAIILGIGVETVKTHSKKLIVKLDATNTAGAVSRAYELGILRA